MNLDKKLVKIISAKIATAFELALDEGSHVEEVDPTRVNRLRISGFPFCQLQWFNSLPRSLVKSRKAESSSRYFTQVGHVLHSVVQDALLTVGLDVHGIEVIGDWECKSCKMFHNIRAKPAKCENCGTSEFKNHEISISNGVLTGHIDTVLHITLKEVIPGWEHGKDFWIPIDYKTTSTYKIQNLERSGIPYLNNIRQLGGYAGQLHELGYPVLPLGFLVYVPRDNPWRAHFAPIHFDFEDEKRRVEVYKKRFIRIATIKKKNDLFEAVDTRPCRKRQLEDFAECKMSASCAGPENRDTALRAMGKVFDRVEAKLPVIRRVKT